MLWWTGTEKADCKRDNSPKREEHVQRLEMLNAEHFQEIVRGLAFCSIPLELGSEKRGSREVGMGQVIKGKARSQIGVLFVFPF